MWLIELSSVNDSSRRKGIQFELIRLLQFLFLNLIFQCQPDQRNWCMYTILCVESNRMIHKRWLHQIGRTRWHVMEVQQMWPEKKQAESVWHAHKQLATLCVIKACTTQYVLSHSYFKHVKCICYLCIGVQRYGYSISYGMMQWYVGIPITIQRIMLQLYLRCSKLSYSEFSYG